jgi:hypothetical protein
MSLKSLSAAGLIAAVAFTWQPGHAIAAVAQPSAPPLPSGDYYVSLDGGSYAQLGGPDPFAGGEIYVDPSLPGLDYADVTLSSPLSLDFDNILSQGPEAGNEWEVAMEDTTDQYQLNLVLDDWSNLLAGADGALIDPSTDVVQLSNSNIVADDFGGTLDVPAPPALPVFATALGLLAIFARRWNRSAGAI